MNDLDQIKRTINNWWIYLILGLLFLGGAFYVFTVPVAIYLTLAIFFAIFMLVDGVGCIALALSNRERMQGWGWQLAVGIITTFIGISLLIHPSLSMTLLPIFVGFWILLKGSFIIGASLDLRANNAKNWGFILVLGILNAFLGVAMVINPVFGASVILILTAISLLMLGISMTSISLWLRRVKVRVTQLKETDSERFEDLKRTVEEYLNNEPENMQAALQHIRKKVDEASQ